MLQKLPSKHKLHTNQAVLAKGCSSLKEHMLSQNEAWDLCPITIRLDALMRAQSIFVGSVRKKGIPHRTYTDVKPREKYSFFLLLACGHMLFCIY